MLKKEKKDLEALDGQLFQQLTAEEAMLVGGMTGQRLETYNSSGQDLGGDFVLD